MRSAGFPSAAVSCAGRRPVRQIGDVEVLQPSRSAVTTAGPSPGTRPSRWAALIVQRPHQPRRECSLSAPCRQRRWRRIAVLVVGRDDDGGGVPPVRRHDRQAPEQRPAAGIDAGTGERDRTRGLGGKIDGDQLAPLLRVTDVGAPGQDLRIAGRGDVGRDVGGAPPRRLPRPRGVRPVPAAPDPRSGLSVTASGAVWAPSGRRPGLSRSASRPWQQLRSSALRTAGCRFDGPGVVGRTGVGSCSSAVVVVPGPIEPDPVESLVADEVPARPPSTSGLGLRSRGG